MRIDGPHRLIESRIVGAFVELARSFDILRGLNLGIARTVYSRTVWNKHQRVVIGREKFRHIGSRYIN
jgi:hypothetical protein